MAHLTTGANVVVSDLLAPLSLCAACCCAAWLTVRSARAGAVTSGPQHIFWTMLLAAGALRAASAAEGRAGATDQIWREGEMILLCVYFPCLLIVFLLHFFADPLPRYQGLDNSKLDKHLFKHHHHPNHCTSVNSSNNLKQQRSNVGIRTYIHSNNNSNNSATTTEKCMYGYFENFVFRYFSPFL